MIWIFCFIYKLITINYIACASTSKSSAPNELFSELQAEEAAADPSEPVAVAGGLHFGGVFALGFWEVSVGLPVLFAAEESGRNRSAGQLDQAADAGQRKPAGVRQVGRRDARDAEGARR